MSARYQEGSIESVKRAKGSVWIYRWRENGVQRKKVIGSRDAFTLAEAKREIENFRTHLNASVLNVGRMTLGEAWGHFQKHELYDPDVDRSPTTIDNYLDYFKSQILPVWKDTALEDLKSVAVEKWLRTLVDLTPGAKAKIRNHMSALLSLHPARAVYKAQSDSLCPSECSPTERSRHPYDWGFQAMLSYIEPPAIRTMVLVAMASALRRSEIRGLRWEDLDFRNLWFHLRRGLVRKHQTKMKTKASRKGVPMLADLTEVLQEWRRTSPYPMDGDWVFASPYTQGVRPYWPDSALTDHIRPAVDKAGINKIVGWHTSGTRWAPNLAIREQT